MYREYLRTLGLRTTESSQQNFNKLASQYYSDVAESTNKYKALKDLDLFVLDNSIRESTVGQLRGHTLESKWEVYNEVKKCGFKNMVVAAFNHMTRVDDVFIKQLVERGEDRNGLYSFSEITASIRQKTPDTESVPLGLEKMKEAGLWNAILEVDLGDATYDFSKFTVDDMCALVLKWINWCHDELHEESKVLVNFRDMTDVMKDDPGRCFYMVQFLANLPERIRPFAILFEEMKGTAVPEECGLWAKYIRKLMNASGWKGHLLVHAHEKFGYSDAVVLQTLMDGANGIWASVCKEGAAMGHASSCVTLMNLIRLGNTKVLKRYNCQYLRKAAINVTQITTGESEDRNQPVYGTRALDLVLGVKPKDFDLSEFFGEAAPVRITPAISPDMLRERLVAVFNENENFNLEIATKMKERMCQDLLENRTEEYTSAFGLAVLFDRAGGRITEQIRDVIHKTELNEPHAENLIAQIREIWDTWDVKDKVQNDDMLEYDSFYNGFMAPYFGCYKCANTRKALQAIDMDADAQIGWKEFLVYIKWALHQYPDTKDKDELLDVTFRKGIIPAMRDELLKYYL